MIRVYKYIRSQRSVDTLHVCQRTRKPNPCIAEGLFELHERIQDFLVALSPCGLENSYRRFRIRQSRKPVCSPRSLFLNILSQDKIVSTFWQAIRIVMLLGMFKCEDEGNTILRNVGICWLVDMA